MAWSTDIGPGKETGFLKLHMKNFNKHNGSRALKYLWKIGRPELTTIPSSFSSFFTLIPSFTSSTFFTISTLVAGPRFGRGITGRLYVLQLFACRFTCVRSFCSCTVFKWWRRWSLLLNVSLHMVHGIKCSRLCRVFSPLVWKTLQQMPHLKL